MFASQTHQNYWGLQNSCHLFRQTFSLEVIYFLHNFVTCTLNLCFPFCIRHQVSCQRTAGKIMVPQLKTGNLSTHPTQQTNTKL